MCWGWRVCAVIWKLRLPFSSVFICTSPQSWAWVLLLSETQCFPYVNGKANPVVLFWWDRIDHPYARHKKQCWWPAAHQSSILTGLSNTGCILKKSFLFSSFFFQMIIYQLQSCSIFNGLTQRTATNIYLMSPAELNLTDSEKICLISCWL